MNGADAMPYVVAFVVIGAAAVWIGLTIISALFGKSKPTDIHWEDGE